MSLFAGVLFVSVPNSVPTGVVDQLSASSLVKTVHFTLQGTGQF